MVTFETSVQGSSLIIFLSGRLDTSACEEVACQVNQLVNDYAPSRSLVVDLQKLEFISSTGLRIMLRLKKHFASLCVINASAEVYSVFEMTGFTKMMPVEKALRCISIEDCKEIGRGGVGIVYRLTDDSIIKVFRKGTSREEVDKEIGMAKEAFILGMPTAISYDVVRVGEQYGLVYEMLNAETLSSAINAHPERLEDYAIRFAHLYREMHAIHVPQESSIPDAFEHEMANLDRIRHYMGDEIVERAKQILQSIPQGDCLLHCDFHPKNVMLQGDELMLIDMGEVSRGNAIIDLGHTCSAMAHLVGDYKVILDLTEEQSQRFFQIMIDEYYKDVPADEKAHNLKLINSLSIVRGISWLSLSDNFPQELIDGSRETFLRRIKEEM